MAVYNLLDVLLTDTATIYSDLIDSTSAKGTLTMQASFVNLTGTSAGTVTLEGSLDGVNFKKITTVAGKFDFYASDTETVIDGLVMQAAVTVSPFAAYRFKVVGSGTHTTTCSFSYLPKLD
jgi:hypothetical protein